MGARGLRIRHASRLLWMVGVFGACTVLAVASKANGALLPVLAWVVDALILRRRDAPETNVRLRVLRTVMLILPSVLLFGWLLLEAAGHARRPRLAAMDRRATPAHRTARARRLPAIARRSRACCRPGCTTMPTSHRRASLRRPRRGVAMLVVLGLVAAAFALRRRAPVFACAVLFFFAGHLLESTVLALELYLRTSQLPARPAARLADRPAR
jgi:hypothetical protein